MMKFEWNIGIRGATNFSLTDDGNQITRISPSRPMKSICSKTFLSADKVSSVSWEMTLMDIKEGVSFMMGIIDGDYIRKFVRDGNRYCVGYSDHQMALRVGPAFRPTFLVHGKASKLQEDWDFDPKIGDKMRLEFNFEENECSAFYNDKLMETVSNTLPKTMYFAVSIYFKGSSYKCSLFKVIPK